MDRFTALNAYCRDVFGEQDEQLATLMPRATAAGIPDIAVSADVGRFLQLLASTTRAQRFVEVGTLAGYSGIWLARALSPRGRLITVELEPRHAAFARDEFFRAEVAHKIDQRLGAALDVLPALAEELGPDSVDVLFLDAIKPEYPRYLEIMRACLRTGALLIADNALGGGDWWVTDAPGTRDSRDAMDAFNRAIARDPAFIAACLPIREGVLVARKIA